MKLEERVNKVFNDIRDLFITTGVVMGGDYLINLPTDYWNRMAPGFDLAIGSGLLNFDNRKTLISIFGLALSMTPELIAFIGGGDYGELSPRALSKGAVYGVVSLLAICGNRVYNKIKK